MAWVVHDAAGRIVQTVEGEVDATFGARVGEMGYTALAVPLPAIMDVPIGTIYVQAAGTPAAAIATRPPFPATLSKTVILANGTDAAVLAGLPDPCTVIVGGNSVVVTGGTASIKSGYPTSMMLQVDQLPYLPWGATVVATAP